MLKVKFNFYILVGACLILILFHKTVFSQQESQTKEKTIAEEWQEEIETIKKEWQKEIEDIQKTWKQQRESILKEWKEERAKATYLMKISLDEKDKNCINKTLVDHKDGKITVTSIATADTEKEARKKALETGGKILERALMFVDIDDELTVGDIIKRKKGGITEKEFTGFIEKNSIKTSKEANRLKGNKIQAKEVMEQPLTGKKGLINVTKKVVLEDSKKKGIEFFTVADISQEDIKAAEKELKEKAPVTGLIIDARKLEFSPSMFVSIRTQKNKEIYGTRNVDLKKAVDNGMVGWDTSLENAKADKRIGKNPLTVKAISAEKSGVLIIDDKDASLVLLAGKKSNFLKNCAVIIVVR